MYTFISRDPIPKVRWEHDERKKLQDEERSLHLLVKYKVSSFAKKRVKMRQERRLLLFSFRHIKFHAF